MRGERVWQCFEMMWLAVYKHVNYISVQNLLDVRGIVLSGNKPGLPVLDLFPLTLHVFDILTTTANCTRWKNVAEVHKLAQITLLHPLLIIISLIIYTLLITF